MAERQIVKYGDPVLREVSEAIDTINSETKDLVSDLIDSEKDPVRKKALTKIQRGINKKGTNIGSFR